MIKTKIDDKDFKVRFKHTPDLRRQRSTICEIFIDGRLTHFGQAVCSRKDQFCRKTGRRLAFNRAVQQLPRYHPYRDKLTEIFNAKEGYPYERTISKN